MGQLGDLEVTPKDLGHLGQATSVHGFGQMAISHDDWQFWGPTRAMPIDAWKAIPDNCPLSPHLTVLRGYFLGSVLRNYNCRFGEPYGMQ